jgi:hypothetical protein
MVRRGVAVEKLAFLEESQNLGDRKCLGEVEKSFVELPDAKQFLRILGERVFQQPQDFATPIIRCLEQIASQIPPLRLLSISGYRR